MDRIKGLAGATKDKMKDKISNIRVAKPKLDWLKYSPVRVKMKECTRNKGSGPSLSDKQEIAQASFDHNQLQEIFQVLWGRLDQKPKNFRSIHRSLIVLNYMLLHGSRNVSTELKFQTHHLQRLQSFYYRDDGREVGSGVRNAAKELLALLRDEDGLDSRRKNAAGGGVSRYQGFGSGDSQWNRRRPNEFDSNYGYGGEEKDTYSSRSYEPQSQRPTIGGGSRNRVTTRPKPDPKPTRSTFDDDEDDFDEKPSGESNITFKKKKKVRKPKPVVRKTSGESTGSGRRGRRGHVRKPSGDEEELKIEEKPKPKPQRVEKPKKKESEMLGDFFKPEEPVKESFDDDGFSEDVWNKPQPKSQPSKKVGKMVTANDFFDDPIIPVRQTDPGSPLKQHNLEMMKETSLDDAFDDKFDDGFATPGPSQSGGGQGTGKDKDEILNFFESSDFFGGGAKKDEHVAKDTGVSGSGGKMTIRQMRNQGAGRKVTRSTVTTAPPPQQYSYTTPPHVAQHPPGGQYTSPYQYQQQQQQPYVGYPPQQPPAQYTTTTNPHNPFY